MAACRWITDQYHIHHHEMMKSCESKRRPRAHASNLVSRGKTQRKVLAFGWHEAIKKCTDTGTFWKAEDMIKPEFRDEKKRW